GAGKRCTQKLIRSSFSALATRPAKTTIGHILGLLLSPTRCKPDRRNGTFWYICLPLRHRRRSATTRQGFRPAGGSVPQSSRSDGHTASVSVVSIWSKDCLDLSADFVGRPFGLVRKDGKAGP